MIIDHFYSATSSTTTRRRSRLQHGYCIGVSRRSAQATVSEGLLQGSNMMARAGVEPTTLRLKVIDSAKVPPCLTLCMCIMYWITVPYLILINSLFCSIFSGVAELRCVDRCRFCMH